MATGSPSDHPPPIQNDDQLQHNQSPPHSQTLDPPISPRSPAGVQNSQQSDDDAQQSEQKDDQPPGKTHPVTLSEPIVLTDDTENPSPPPLTSRNNKRKKPPPRKTYKRKRPTKKIITLTDALHPIPFAPSKTLDLDKHEEVLKKLGLYEFSKIEFDRIVRSDLIVQLIGTYDPKKRCSYVNASRIGVNRADLARALKLPAARQDRGGGGVEEVDLDSEVFSDEAIEFVEDFVSSWIVLHDEAHVVSGEMVSWVRFIRDGHPEKMDPATLIWNRVEKELTQGDKLVNCYYASHLLYLIRSQKPDLFVEDGNDDDDDDVEQHVKAPDEEKVEEKYEEIEEKAEKEQDEGKEKESMVQEQNLELNLETEVEEPALEVVTKDETKDDEAMADADAEEQVDFNDDHFLQPCRNNSLVVNFEQVVKVEEVEEEHIEQVVKVEEVEDEHVEEVEDEQVDDEEEGGERIIDEGFDMEEANDDSFDRDGLTDNFLQGVETTHNPYNSHGMDLFGSRDGSFGGPSFYNNGGKRVMEPEEDIQMQNDSKRIKTDEIWDQKQNDIGLCFDQIQQLMQKAKMIHETKERSYENTQYSQQLAVNELQQRQQYMEMIIKSKDEELEKKHNEVFRLEREIYLMTDLLSGYRKALNDTRSKFSEYRKRFQLKEEPLYRDAGPGGLVLSVREIEKQRLKQEEDMRKIQIIAKNFEQDCVYQLEMHYKRLSPMFDKLVAMENEVRMLKELAPKPKETQVEPSAEDNQKLVNEVELSVEAEENQKLVNEVELSVEVQKSMVEDEPSVEPEKSVVEDEYSVEPEKSMDEDDKNLKSVDEDEAGRNQEAVDEITEK